MNSPSGLISLSLSSTTTLFPQPSLFILTPLCFSNLLFNRIYTHISRFYLVLQDSVSDASIPSR